MGSFWKGKPEAPMTRQMPTDPMAAPILLS